jgi:hypothetical protein
MHHLVPKQRDTCDGNFIFISEAKLCIKNIIVCTIDDTL